MTAKPTAVLDITVLIEGLDDALGPDNASRTVLDLASRGAIKGVVCATAIEPLVERLLERDGEDRARSDVQRLCATMMVAPADAGVIDGALSLGARYLDDAMTLATARHLGASHLVTLNGPDFADPTIQIQSPEEFLNALAAH
jgi:predicted nucleic acid-binding protein